MTHNGLELLLNLFDLSDAGEEDEDGPRLLQLLLHLPLLHVGDDIHTFLHTSFVIQYPERTGTQQFIAGLLQHIGTL